MNEPARTEVNRRVGGLEEGRFAGRIAGNVNRRVGGLEGSGSNIT